MLIKTLLSLLFFSVDFMNYFEKCLHIKNRLSLLIKKQKKYNRVTTSTMKMTFFLASNQM